MIGDFMNDLQKIYDLIDQFAGQTNERDYPIIWEKAHAVSCAQIGRMLAEIRKVDKEQAALACALHDIGRWETGQQLEHASKGEVPVRQFLADGKYSAEMQEQIIQAVINHSKKELIGTPLEELVKDADLLDCYWHGEHIQKPFHLDRLKKALYSLGIRWNSEGENS